jgi:transcriptional regulator with XRE-family HTH domain
MSNTFAAILRKLMLAKGLTASKLAGLVWGKKKDKRGFMVSKNRDRIGHYLSGKSFPNDANLVKIAKVLGVSPDTLRNAIPPRKVREPDPDRRVEGLHVTYYTGLRHHVGNLSVAETDLSVTTILAIKNLIDYDPVHMGLE